MTRQSTKDFFKEYFSKEEPKKQMFKPNIEEDLNRPHKVTLTEGQISTYDNLFDKLADLSDTSRADDFYKQPKRIKHGKDLDCL